ncbi:MAG: heterodisulfide reductase, partial [Chloroflexi bacterium]|nr:heterodisulfide reductase [Chloroflexota bacterium]
EGHPLITVHRRTELARLEGFVGNFHSTLKGLDTGPEEEKIVEHGVLIVATGAQERRTTEYLYGENPCVLTQRELEERLAAGDFALQGHETIVMIQCVGSRTAEHPYCSRICCSQAIKNAIALKKRWPQSTVVILYRDIRTYGLREAYYRQARDLGILFIPYEPQPSPVRDGPPRVEPYEEA